MRGDIHRRLDAVERAMTPPLVMMSDWQLALIVGRAFGLTPDEVLALPDEALERVAAGCTP